METDKIETTDEVQVDLTTTALREEEDLEETEILDETTEDLKKCIM
jgi:dsDNA-specific endonuclease/ATPase MutS2